MVALSAHSWKIWQKVTFRFFFLFIFLSTIFCWNLVVVYLVRAFYNINEFNPGKMYEPLKGLFHWLDKNIYHTGYNPELHRSFPQDNHFGAVFYLTFILFSIIGAITWSIADRKRKSYDRLYYWFRLYIRYILALVIFGYGISKLIPQQMFYPGVISLVTPLGEQTRYENLWNFIGISPGFQMFCGACEITASLLVLNRRTAVFGSIFMCIILGNVVAYNVFYNVPVKMFSFQLLVYALFLITPYLKNLSKIFFYSRSGVLSEKYFVFETAWKKYLVNKMLTVFPLIFFLIITMSIFKIYTRKKNEEQKQRIYNVVTFITRDTLPPLLTDSFRWKRFALAYTNSAVVYHMNDTKEWFEFEVDSIKKTLTLYDSPDTATWQVFHYENRQDNELALAGSWKGNEVRIIMNEMSVDSMVLQTEKIRLIQD